MKNNHLNSCLYLIGFESDFDIPELSKMMIDGGSYIKVDFHGLQSKLGEAYTWIMKYYMPKKGLKYDYRPQFQEYNKAPDFSQNETTCKIFIPILRA
jgi:predicted transcriptional regulator YdeE